MSKQNGGPAFPALTRLSNTTRQYGEPDYIAETVAGMSLRDYFAAHALAGWSESHHACESPDDAPFASPVGPYHERMARVAYRIADAMLKAREDQ